MADNTTLDAVKHGLEQQQQQQQQQQQHSDFIQWTPTTILFSIVLFCFWPVSPKLVAEWLVWPAIRVHTPWWWGFLGSMYHLNLGSLETISAVDFLPRKLLEIDVLVKRWI